MVVVIKVVVDTRTVVVVELLCVVEGLVVVGVVVVVRVVVVATFVAWILRLGCFVKHGRYLLTVTVLVVSMQEHSVPMKPPPFLVQLAHTESVYD